MPPASPSPRDVYITAFTTGSLLATTTTVALAGLGVPSAWLVVPLALTFCGSAAALSLQVSPTARPPAVDPLTVTYERLHVVGEGQEGTVYIGRHRHLGSLCAIKTLKPESSTRRDRKRFEREARVLAALRSPHTVRVHDFGARNDGALYFVMELLEGIDLQSLVDETGCQPPARVAAILIQACHSLDEAHGAGLVHRDLKPANLMLCRIGLDEDFVKVVDFGMAKDAHNVGEARLTGQFTVMGTAAYLAPESLKGSASVDGRADLYALGCIAFWLLTGELVFPETSVLAMAKAHFQEQPRPLRELRPDIPKSLEAIIMACLAKDPSHRPATGGDLAQRLEATGLASGWTLTAARRWWNERPAQDQRRSAKSIPPAGSGRRGPG